MAKNKKTAPSILQNQEDFTQEDFTQEDFTDDKPSEDLTYDLAQLRNIALFKRITHDFFRTWLSPLYAQGGISFFRSLFSAALTDLIPKYFAFYNKSNTGEIILSTYSKTYRTVYLPLQTPVDLIISSLWRSHAERISRLSQPFSPDGNFSRPPRSTLYLPQVLGAAILVSRLNRDFLQSIQENFTQLDYPDLYGVGLVIGTEAFARFLGPYVFREMALKTNYSLSLTQEEIDEPDILDQNYRALLSSDYSILSTTAIFALFTSLILPQFFSSPQFSSLSFENIDWSFVINLMTAYFIRTFVLNLMSPQDDFRENLAKRTSISLNTKFGRTIESEVVTSHDFIQVTCKKTKDPEADKTNFSFFILALGIYCKANIISEGGNEFMFALFQRFDETTFKKKLLSRFKIHKQLYRFIHSITNWQRDKESSNFQITLTPFNGGEEISWSIAVNEFNEPLQIQNCLQQVLIESYSGEDNKELDITIQNGELIIHGLQKYQPDNEHLKKNIGKLINKLNKLNLAQAKSNTNSAKPQYYKSTQYTFYSSPAKDSQVKSIRTGSRQVTSLEEKYNDAPISKKLTANEKWVSIEADAKALCAQAREKLSATPALKFKGGDPKEDAFFALIETKDNVPLYIRCIVWAQGLTRDLINEITDNEPLYKVLESILNASKESCCVTTSPRSHEGTATGIVKCASSEGFPYKLFVKDARATRCGIATVEIDKFNLTLPSESKSGNLTPYRLAIMDINQRLGHQKYDRAAARMR